MSWEAWGSPPDPEPDPRDEGERLFQACEDARSDFEAYANSHGYTVMRIKGATDCARGEYFGKEGDMWMAWLAALNIEWVPEW